MVKSPRGCIGGARPVPSPTVASLVALLAAIVLSCTTRLNVGLIATALAWIIGVFLAGWTADAVAAGFPTALFLTLAGVTLLFAIAELNGTVDGLARRAMRLARGRARLVPVVIFAIAMIISTLGPGAVATVALLAPIAMALGARYGLSPLVIGLMVANGANAGNLSPISAVGIVANTKMASVGLGGHEWLVWATNFGAHVVAGLAAWLLFGRPATEPPATPATGATEPPAAPSAVAEPPPLDGRQWLTLGVIGVWVLAVVYGKAHVGFAAFAGGVLLVALGAADEGAAVKRMPWGAILMVCGVSILINVLEKTGGMALFTSLLAALATPGTINGVIALVTGAISTWSSTSGVVLPAFLPAVPSLVARVGGGDPLAVALSINVGSSLVDVSPLSTLGALCVAAVADPVAARHLFRSMLIWGLSMVLVGAVLCQLLAGWLATI
jgi:di/tricarboxylate transporter